MDKRPIITLALCGVGLLLASSASAADHTTPLFDGRTFAGWEGETSNLWRIEGGEIVAGSAERQQPANDFLCTTREFGDFDLRLQYRRGTSNGGVQFRSRRVPNSHEVAGYQADMRAGIDGWLYDESRRRVFLAQPDPATSARLGLGEWNRCRIRAEGPRIRIWINDVLTVDYQETDPSVPRRGIIGLQLHKDAREIRYKDLVIEELADSGGTTATGAPSPIVQSPSPTAPAAWQPEPGFQELFNGRDLQGWHYQGDADLATAIEATDGRYSAKDGMLVVNPEVPGKGPHLRQLWTLREFPTDFTLKLEFRASVNADSGIFIRGKQLQCRDYLVAGPYKNLKAYKPQDWNEIVIVVTGTTAHCTCNGEVLKADLEVPATGPIGLEADRGQMEYRRIRINMR
jgi:hypothetical protein